MSQQCPECGAQLPANTPSGLCPACLLKRGLESNTVGYTVEAPPGRWVPPAVDELAPRFPELEIARLIGRGGMGAVYQARQKNLDRIVALKILPPEMGLDPAFAERFAREAQAMARLNHPHIVTIHEFGQRAGLYFFIMEFVDGVSLRGLLDSGLVTPKEALAIVPQICEALQYAHDQGIVHRDIKPENILINKQGQVKIADFGLAKLMGRQFLPTSGTPGESRGGGLGPPEKIMGTPQYMAPEQIDHPADVDHRADIYSLGVVFYQMLTGELPTSALTPPSRKVVIDVRLDEVVLRAMEKSPERRYQQASEVKTQVETIACSPTVTPRPQLELVQPLHVITIRDGKAFYNWPGLFAYGLLASLPAVGIVLCCLAISWPERQLMPYIAPLIGFVVAALLGRHRIRREMKIASERRGGNASSPPAASGLYLCASSAYSSAAGGKPSRWPLYCLLRFVLKCAGHWAMRLGCSEQLAD